MRIRGNSCTCQSCSRRVCISRNVGCGSCTCWCLCRRTCMRRSGSTAWAVGQIKSPIPILVNHCRCIDKLVVQVRVRHVMCHIAGAKCQRYALVPIVPLDYDVIRRRTDCINLIDDPVPFVLITTPVRVVNRNLLIYWTANISCRCTCGWQHNWRFCFFVR